MSFSVSKQNGKLIYKVIDKGYDVRNDSTFWCIQKADEIYNWNDFSELIIYTDDYEKNINDFTYSKNNSYHNLIPDFNFHAWPNFNIDDYDKIIKEIDKASICGYKLFKVGWIGYLKSSPLRSKLFNVGNKHSDLLDIYDSEISTWICIPDLVKTYAILIDIEGSGYSGRFKHLLWSRRPILLIDRPHKEFFFKYLIEWYHYIPVKRDLSDLIEKTKWCMDNYDIALKIATNAFEFSKLYLTRSSCYNEWNNVITNHINNSK